MVKPTKQDYFPSQVVSDAEKRSYEYGLKVAKAIEHEWLGTKSGGDRLKFNQNNFEQFKDKIIYLIYDQVPENIEDINTKDTEKDKSRKLIMNAIFRENGQRNFI